MVSFDWAAIPFDVVSMVLTFVIITIIARIALLVIDKALPSIDFTIIKEDPKAEAVASVGWFIIYAFAFAGALKAPYYLDIMIYMEIIWGFIMIMVAAILTVIFVKLLSPFFGYCSKSGPNTIGKEPLATAIFYLGICILIGVLSYSSLVA